MRFYLYQNILQVHSSVWTTAALFSLLSIDFTRSTYYSAIDDNLQRIKDEIANTSLKS